MAARLPYRLFDRGWRARGKAKDGCQIRALGLCGVPEQFSRLHFGKTQLGESLKFSPNSITL